MNNHAPRSNDVAAPAPRAQLPAPMQSEIGGGNSSTKVEMQRAVAEVQAAVYLAKQFPRDVTQAIEEIKQECSRLELAEVATYEYARGGTKIDGPSIRLAEVISLCWQNNHSGWRELSRGFVKNEQVAEIECWAWDVERNRKETIVFSLKLVRNTKNGSYPLVDERDIYEHCANNAKRRERSAILSIIPTYIVDLAVEKCNDTLKKSITPDKISAMVKAFDGFGIPVEKIEKFIQCSISAITPAHVVRLRNIYNSIRDGMSQTGDWFDNQVKETSKKAAETKPETATVAQSEEKPVAAEPTKTAAPESKPVTSPSPATKKAQEQKPLFGAD